MEMLEEKAKIVQLERPYAIAAAVNLSERLRQALILIEMTDGVDTPMDHTDIKAIASLLSNLADRIADGDETLRFPILPEEIVVLADIEHRHEAAGA